MGGSFDFVSASRVWQTLAHADAAELGLAITRGVQLRLLKHMSASGVTI